MLSNATSRKELGQTLQNARSISRRKALKLSAAASLGIGLGHRLPNYVPTMASSLSALQQTSLNGGIHRFTIGDFECRIFDDGEYGFPAQLVAINAGPAELASEVAASGRQMDYLPTTMNILLVDTGSELVLFDTGFGHLSAETGLLGSGLESEGIAPGDIDIVVLSHMHADHYGGALSATGESVFSNARYLMNATEHEYWWSEPDLAELPLDEDFKQFFREAAKGTLIGLESQIELIEPGAEIVPGILALEAYGHTPGHLAFQLTHGEEALLHIVDAVGDEMHLSHPDWFLAPESWPAAAMLTRRALLNRAVAEDLAVLAFHLPFPGLGKVSSDGDGWNWLPTI